jgi:hypothetical protein
MIIGSPLPDRPARLRFIQHELREMRLTLAELAGTDRVGEIRLLDDLAIAVAELARQSARPRSSASSVRRWHPTTTNQPEATR